MATQRHWAKIPPEIESLLSPAIKDQRARNVWHDCNDGKKGNFELNVSGFYHLFPSCSLQSFAVTTKSNPTTWPLFDRPPFPLSSLIKSDQIPAIWIYTALSLQFVSKWALTFGLKISPLSPPIHIQPTPSPTLTPNPHICLHPTHADPHTHFSTPLSNF